MNDARDHRPLAGFVAWDAVTSLGESAAETALLLRAGLCNVAPSRFIDAVGERVMFCRAPAIPPELNGLERIATLARQALWGLSGQMSRLRPVAQRAARPVMLLSLPEWFAAGETGHRLADRLRDDLPPAFRGVEIEIFPFGRAAGAPALVRAIRCVERGRLVIWGGIDSLHDWTVLEALERSDRLLTAENIDGVRPGESAAFVTMEPADAGSSVHVLGVGMGREPCPVGSEEPCKSLGLSSALETALAPLRATRLRSNCWLLDNSHEIYATQELQNIIARFSDVLGLEASLDTPLKELGDVGAAAMPLLAVLGAEAWRLGYANDNTAVITGCSDGGARGAVLLSANEGARA